ncbi:MAG: hypothetical protein NC311_07615 [Muribaculaceae bacterium]|nr:hypothetical protein [Muribaculaceae bacterium]
MMEEKQYYQSPRMSVLQGLHTLLSPIAEKVFLTTRPSAVSEQMKDYIVLRMNNGLRDRADTYQTGIAHVTLFARDKSGEIENTFRLQQMMDAFLALIPIKQGLFTADRPRQVGGGGDSGFHYVTFQISVTVNKINFFKDPYKL